VRVVPLSVPNRRAQLNQHNPSKTWGSSFHRVCEKTQTGPIGRKFARLPLNKSDISAILPAGFLDVLREIPNVGEDSDFERIQSESSADLFD